MMRGAIALLLVVSACSGGSTTPAGACMASDPACNPSSVADAGVASDARGDMSDTSEGAATDAADAADGACSLWVDDAGVTMGCTQGGMGPGDRDDGGDAGAPPPPDAALDASDLGFGASCWDNAQCASDLCFDFKARGQFCTRICSTNADCPPPSPGCNGMGVCRTAAGM
jgi:hypothetical protein